MKLENVHIVNHFDTKENHKMKGEVMMLVADLYHLNKAKSPNKTSEESVLTSLSILKEKLGTSGSDMPWPDQIRTKEVKQCRRKKAKRSGLFKTP